MAVANRGSIRGRQPQQAPQDDANKKGIVEYSAGEETVKLSPSIVRNYLVRGNGNVTDQEVGLFINLCRFQHLNPFLNEAYLVKFGSQPATIVTGKEALTKRAMRNKAYRGQQAGVVVMNPKTGEIENRIGSLVLPNEQLVGGWAKVFVEGFDEPMEMTVGLAEYIGTKADGSANSNWAKKPGTMIRKVALMQALREAFPEDLGGLYSEEEGGVEATQDQQPLIIPQDEQTPAPQIEAAPVNDQPIEAIFSEEQQTITELDEF